MSSLKHRFAISICYLDHFGGLEPGRKKNDINYEYYDQTKFINLLLETRYSRKTKPSHALVFF